VGKPNADRTWTECFAQLVGTILSLWDAAELDAAGQDGEVLPKFINLTDASIRIVSLGNIVYPNIPGGQSTLHISWDSLLNPTNGGNDVAVTSKAQAC
jgi:hypothetical protein